MIENICGRDAKLFFTQVRKVAPEEVDVIVAVCLPPAARLSSASAMKDGEGEREISRAPAPKRAASPFQSDPSTMQPSPAELDGVFVLP